MKHYIKLFLLLFISSNYSQVGGENVYQFLNLSSSASQIALGGQTLTLSSDINQPIFNPSFINEDLDGQFSIDYTNYLAGINIGSFSYAKTLDRDLGTFHINIKYLDYGTLIGADETGFETGNFNANDFALSIGYSRELIIPNLFLGANLKLINSSIGLFNSIGIASDLSLLHKSEESPYTYTLVARNLGFQLTTFNGVKEALPLKIAAGLSYELEYVPLKWHFTIDDIQQWDITEPNPSNQETDLDGTTSDENIDFFDNALRHLIIGAEFFPDSNINVRLGYNFKRASELELQNIRSFSGLSFGFGFKLNRFKFNYAMSRVHSASNVSTFGLEIDLNSF